MRCDLHTHAECSCIASGVSCRVQAPLYLGTYRGTNNPGPLDGYPKTARDMSFALILLSAIVFAICIGAGLTVGPVNV